MLMKKQIIFLITDHNADTDTGSNTCVNPDNDSENYHDTDDGYDDNIKIDISNIIYKAVTRRVYRI